MSNKSIEVLIQPSGEVQIEAVGFKGNACEKATAALEAALGATKARRKKPEYHQQNTAGQGQRT
ncbi:MAG: hypothetical protein QOE70_950 [Chthoniobacter sp.]|jgi:hypothetical protein|nr:hypothetical protein [Chthoniobacter sp.]